MSEKLPEYVTICCDAEFAQTWLSSRAAEGYELVGTVADSYGGQGLTYVMRLTRQARIEQRAADSISELLNKAMDNDKFLLALQATVKAQEQRIAALETDNARLRADLDAANRRWDAWAQIVQPELLKASQLDTERRLAEVERRVEGQG